jgi:hypothetical protein
MHTHTHATHLPHNVPYSQIALFNQRLVQRNLRFLGGLLPSLLRLHVHARTHAIYALTVAAPVVA